MNIRWNNVFIAIVGITIALLALRYHTECGTALHTVTTVLPHNGDNRVDDRFVGFMVLGVLAVALVAIVKLIVGGQSGQGRNDRRDQRDNDHDG